MESQDAWWSKLFPFLTWWPMVNRETVKADLMAGLTGAIIVLPQGVAFAMIAGMPPVYGLYTAMVTPIIAALFGSSWHLISGPTTAISLVVFATLKGYAEPASAEFVELALVLTFLAGVFQLGMGLARFGTLVNFVSHSVVVGFTAGAALLIGVSQLRHVLGLRMPRGLAFHETLVEIAHKLADVNLWVVLVAVATLAVAVLMKKILPKWPNLLFAMVAGSMLTLLLGSDKGILLVEEMPARLPPFRIPNLSLNNITTLGTSAFAIALLGLIEAVAIGRSIAVKTQQRLDGNQEFIGQGLSNTVASFFSCYAGSGSFTRSGVNYTAGARTPLSAIFAALFLAIVVVFVAPLSGYLPIPAMGGVILLVAYNLIDIEEIGKVFRASKSETIVLVATFLATLFFELEFAIYIGVFLSLFFYLRRTSKPNIAAMAPSQSNRRHHFLNVIRDPELRECPQLKVIRIDGSLFYGAIEHVESFFAELRGQSVQRVLVLCAGINSIDLAGAEWLHHEVERWRKQGGDVYFTGLKMVAQQTLIRSGVKKLIGEDHFFTSKKAALATIYGDLDPSICRACAYRIFWECQEDDSLPQVELEAHMQALPTGDGGQESA